MRVHLFDLKNYWQNQGGACNEAFLKMHASLVSFNPIHWFLQNILVSE